MSNYQSFINLNRPILISGPTGTGKSQLAKRIFSESTICKSRFITMHLASIKEELLESELFGHKKGAFTGAVENKQGYLAEVVDGTLFLDEIGELSLEAQKKLLYLLEERKFTPVGETKAFEFKGRLLMATNCDLLKLVEEKKFREDLYYRLITFELKLAPLFKDQKKLKSSIESELMRSNVEYGKKCYFNEENLQKMLDYHWPGNFRELKNTIELLVVTSVRPEIEFSKESAEKEKTADQLEDIFLSDFHQSVELFEALYLKHVLTLNKGKINDTARKIGLSKAALIYKSKKYAINTWKIKGNHFKDQNDLAA